MKATEPLIQATLIGEAVDNGPALVFVADEHMRYAAVNATACAELGYTREELVGMSVAEVARYGDASEEFGAMVRGGGRRGAAELTRKDGTTFRLRYVAAETTVGGMPFYVSVGWPE